MEDPPSSSFAQSSALFSGLSKDEIEKSIYFQFPVSDRNNLVESSNRSVAISATGELQDFKYDDFREAYRMMNGPSKYPFQSIAQISNYKFDPYYFDGSESDPNINVNENLIGTPLGKSLLEDPRLAYVKNLLTLKEYEGQADQLNDSYIKELYMVNSEKGANYYQNMLDRQRDGIDYWSREGRNQKQSEIPGIAFSMNLPQGDHNREKKRVRVIQTAYSETPNVQRNYRRELMDRLDSGRGDATDTISYRTGNDFSYDGSTINSDELSHQTVLRNETINLDYVPFRAQRGVVYGGGEDKSYVWSARTPLDSASGSSVLDELQSKRSLRSTMSGRSEKSVKSNKSLTNRIESLKSPSQLPSVTLNDRDLETIEREIHKPPRETPAIIREIRAHKIQKEAGELNRSFTTPRQYNSAASAWNADEALKVAMSIREAAIKGTEEALAADRSLQINLYDEEFDRAEDLKSDRSRSSLSTWETRKEVRRIRDASKYFKEGKKITGAKEDLFNKYMDNFVAGTLPPRTFDRQQTNDPFQASARATVEALHKTSRKVTRYAKKWRDKNPGNEEDRQYLYELADSGGRKRIRRFVDDPNYIV